MPLPSTARAQRANNRREQILAAAEELFRVQGFQQVPLSAIAEKAGVTQPGILHHFGSKDNLLIEVLTRREGEELPAHGIALVQHLIDTVATNVERPGIVQAFTLLSAESTTPGHPGAQYFGSRYATLRTQVSAEVATLIAEGVVGSAVKPESAAACIIALLDGLQVQWLHDPAGIDMISDAAAGIESILRLDPGTLAIPRG